MPKSANAFRTISEAADEVGTPQHVLRFWETKFIFVTPVKRAGGRRFYRPQDVMILKAIKRLLHEEGLTIKGVQRLHKEQGIARVAAYGGAGASFSMDAEPVEMSSSPVETASDTPDAELLRDVLARIEAAKARLDAVLAA